MSPRNKKALVLWPKEDKASIESLSNVPETSRFVGAVTPEQFLGKKKWYPGKILMISDDDEALERKATLVAEEIAAKKAAAAKAPPSKKIRQANAKKNTRSSLASEQDVARALGERVPVRKELEETHKSAKKSKSDAKLNHDLGQNQLDSEVLSSITEDLFSDGDTNSGQDTSKKHCIRSDASSEVENCSLESENDDEKDTENDVAAVTKGPVWCSCSPCHLLEKYDNPTFSQFLKDLLSSYEASRDAEGSPDSPRYLKQIPVKDGVKKAELTQGTGVFLPLSVKDQLKVDFANKPTALAKAVLFSIYGTDAFKTLPVTGRGNRPGTYGIEEHVLKSVVSFVNRHVNGKSALKVNKLVAYINKRAPEWRKTTPSPKEKKVNQKNVLRTKTSNVISTSPFKCSPFKSQEANRKNATRSQKSDAVSTSPFNFKSPPLGSPKRCGIRPEGESRILIHVMPL